MQFSLDTKEEFDKYVLDLLKEKLVVYTYKDSRNCSEVLVVQVMLGDDLVSEDYAYL